MKLVLTQVTKAGMIYCEDEFFFSEPPHHHHHHLKFEMGAAMALKIHFLDRIWQMKLFYHTYIYIVAVCMSDV